MNQSKNIPNHTLSRFDVFFEHASMGIVIVNSKGEIISANPFLLKLFEYTDTELIGKKIEVLIPSRFRHNHEKHRDGYVEQPKNRPMGIGFDLFGVKKDGAEFPVEVSLSYYEQNKEKFAIGFISDITKRKKDEEEILKINNELKKTAKKKSDELAQTLIELEDSNEKQEISIAYQKAILDNAGVMLFVMNTKGVIQFFNPEAEKITGYNAEEVVGKLTPDIFHAREDLDVCKNELRIEFGIDVKNDADAIMQKAKKNHLREKECRYVKKDGSVFPVSLTITVIYEKKNKINGYLGVAIDISHQKKAEVDLMEALKKEKKLNELKSRFVSMASHEFRTPLSTILSSAYLIEKYNKTDQQGKRESHLHRIISSVNLLTDILNDFLSVGKIEEGKIPLRLVEFNIKEIIQSVIQDMSISTKNGQQFEYDHFGKEKVLLDQVLLKHIALNLFSNAIKFSPEDVNIKVESEVNKDEIRFSVTDRGIGISEEDQEHLMERFFRGSNAANIQGTGLGLYIVSKYAQRMNGQIECVSSLYKGTTFNVIFKPINIPL